MRNRRIAVLLTVVAVSVCTLAPQVNCLFTVDANSLALDPAVELISLACGTDVPALELRGAALLFLAIGILAVRRF